MRPTLLKVFFITYVQRLLRARFAPVVIVVAVPLATMKLEFAVNLASNSGSLASFGSGLNPQVSLSKPHTR